MSTGVAVARAGTPRRARRGYALPFFLFTGPLLLGLAVFTFVPVVWGFLLSFSRARGNVALGDWVGLQNYQTLLGDAAFRQSLLTILGFTVAIVPLTFVLALGIALLVNEARAGRAFYRTVFFIPFAVSYVVASLVWKMGLFTVPFGLVNQAMELVGRQPIAWISTPSPPLYWVVLVSVRLWLQLGFYMIIFLVGLQEIPAHLYEAARVDGARRGWATFRHITLPQLRNTSIAIVILLFINAFQAFDEFYNIMSAGLSAAGSGNVILARVPLQYLYDVALKQQDYGRGAAGAFILSVLIVLVTFLQGRIFGFGRSLD